MHINIKDLPAPQFVKPRSRRVYAVFWAPIGACWDLVTSYLRSLRLGFGLAALGGAAFLGLMYFTGRLTADAAFGLAFATIIAGAGLSALFMVLTALR